MKDFFNKTKEELKVFLLTGYLAAKDPRTPWPARLLMFLMAAYAFSPIDLIPDFVPIFGHLDDLLVIPIGLWLAFSLMPKELIEEFREKAKEGAAIDPNHKKLATAAVVIVWIAAAATAGFAIYSYVNRRI